MTAATMRPFAPMSRFVAAIKVVPATVEVANVDGSYHDSRRLRDAAAALTDAADALDRMRRTTS